MYHETLKAATIMIWMASKALLYLKISVSIQLIALYTVGNLKEAPDGPVHECTGP